ncbi:MAG: Methylmalonyl-CoA mutase, large subunit, partial [Frankiales bacterium]|nr:Methylmalonyl-CoA mutase, large subunit [Frankiales bacterium]
MYLRTMTAPPLHVPVNPVRFVTSASLFDGHDAAINIMRRVLQSQGVEVIHLGHDRSVDAVVQAALQEDVQGVAISSYQGGHVEYFSYLVERLAEVGAGHVKVFGGGGGVIVPEEIALLRSRGVTIFAPEDGQRLGLPGMINTLVEACDVDLAGSPPAAEDVLSGNPAALARAITVLEAGRSPQLAAELAARAGSVPVLGITGTGGSGKSSLTDELLRRFRLDQEDKLRIAVLAIDPTRRKGGGALLGDRIRMNSLSGTQIYFRSLATRTSGTPVPTQLGDIITACKAAGFDLVVIETPGIGQGDATITDFCDVSLYVMTPEYGAASQLEKIDMLDHADVVAINKYERRGAEDARRDVARQIVRNRQAFGQTWEDMPVYGTSAARFNDDGVTALYQHLRGLLVDKGLTASAGLLPAVATKVSTGLTSVLPSSRERYLAEIASTVRDYHAVTSSQASIARRRQHLMTARELVTDGAELDGLLASVVLDPSVAAALDAWPATRLEYAGDELVYTVRDREIHTPLRRDTLSGSSVPRVAVPRTTDHGELVSFLRRENLPGYFPFTAGVFPFKRQGESPARMFAGEGDAFRTNRRFKVLSTGPSATRLSTAFDSVTLYGRDPDPRPDIYGKVGTSGVSIATLDDMKVLYDGFDLCAPDTSVSMTINGPAPTILAMFLNTAIDQRLALEPDRDPAEVRAWVLQNVRGTVQADILKEDQGQNTCIFSTEFALRAMADIQQWFVDHQVRNFYSVSISGYHIAEAGANPISQLAFTLSNGFTYVEAYLARGM